MFGGCLCAQFSWTESQLIDLSKGVINKYRSDCLYEKKLLTSLIFFPKKWEKILIDY